MRVLIVVLALLAGCDRIELATREAEKPLPGAMAMQQADQLKLCHSRDGGSYEVDKCMVTAGWEKANYSAPWSRQ